MASDPEEEKLMRSVALQNARAVLLARERAERALIEAQESLRQSEERYRLLFTSMDQGFCIVEVLFDDQNTPIDYRFLEVNSAFAKQTGLKDARGKRMRELVPDHEKHWFEIYGTIALTGEPSRFENRAEALGGWYEVYAFRVGVPEKRQVAIFFNAINERKQAEMEREQLASILERSLNEIYIFDSKTLRFTYVNEGALHNLGYSLEEIRKKTPLDLKPEFTEASFREMVKPLLSGEKEKHVFYTFHRRRNGTDYPVEVHLRAVDYGGAKVFLAVILDITERAQAEELSSRLAAIVDHTDDAVVSKDLNGIIQSWNKGAERIFGYLAHEIVGKSVTVLIPPDRHNEEPAILHRLRAGERIDHYETVRRRKDGTLIDISITVSPVRDKAGRIIGASKIGREITERKRIEAALKDAQEALTRQNQSLDLTVKERTTQLEATILELEAFSYSISHDMRSPLRAMQGYADALLKDYKTKLEPEGIHYLQRIHRGATRLEMLVRDVLAYSKVAKGAAPLYSFNPATVIKDVVESYPDLTAAHARVEVSPLPSVMGHEGLFMQIVSNLLGNAIKFAKDGVRPEISISGETQGDNVRLWFADNGIGIDSMHHQQIFQIFGRVHPDKMYEGTGIGLAIVKKAAERMGGSVGVESHLGRGSRFWILLKKGL